MLGHQLQDLLEEAAHACVGEVGHHHLDLARSGAHSGRDGGSGGRLQGVGVEAHAGAGDARLHLNHLVDVLQRG